MEDKIKSNLDLIHRWISAANSHDVEKIGETLHNDYEYELGNSEIKGKQKVLEEWKLYLEGLPDLHYEVVLIMANDDNVAARLRMTGTQTGPFRFVGTHSLDHPIPPSNKPIDIPTAGFFKIKDGKIINFFSYWDTNLFMQQIG